MRNERGKGERGRSSGGGRIGEKAFSEMRFGGVSDSVVGGDKRMLDAGDGSERVLKDCR